jgi:hypothetical protein
MKDFLDTSFAIEDLGLRVAPALPNYPGKPWAIPLPAYLSPAPVRPTHLQADDIRVTWRAINLIAEEIHPFSWTVHSIRADLAYAIHRGRIFIRRNGCQTLVAADSHSYPLAMPGGEGRGYGSALRMMRSLLSMQRTVTHFSPTGFRAAISAHRQLVWWALTQGMDVPGVVLQDYALDPRAGGLRLIRSYGEAEHRAYWS